MQTGLSKIKYFNFHVNYSDASPNQFNYFEIFIDFKINILKKIKTNKYLNNFSVVVRGYTYSLIFIERTQLSRT